MRCTSVSDEVSVLTTTDSISEEKLLSSAETDSRPERFRSAKMKCVQPSSAKARAVARPMPLAAPVMRATLDFEKVVSYVAAVYGNTRGWYSECASATRLL